MANNFWASIARREERLIAACTSLKTKVVLMADGVDMECGTFSNSHEAGNWMARKASDWRIHSPLCRVRFRTE